MCMGNLPRIDGTPAQGGYRSPDESGQKGSAHQEIVRMQQAFGEGQKVMALGNSRLRLPSQIALYSDKHSTYATPPTVDTFPALGIKAFPYIRHLIS